MKRVEFLDKAKSLISGKREEDYGTPRNNFTLIANLWTLWLEARFGVAVHIEPEDVAVMMQQVKQARLANDITHEDGWTDNIGYAALGGEIATEDA